MAGEAGHHANLPYHAQDGSWHLNGAALFDANENAVLASVGSTDALQSKGVARITYDFAVDGGAIATITPSTSPALPNKAVVTRAYYEVLTTVTSGGSATVAVGIESTVDLLAATAIATMGTSGFHELIPDGTAAKFVKTTTATRKCRLTVATAALTAGKMVLFLEYVVTA